MSFSYTGAALAVRENRLRSVTGFSGDVETLLHQSRCGAVKNCGRCFTQASACLSMYAVWQMLRIRNVAVVYHAPAGCAALAITVDLPGHSLAAAIGKTTSSAIVCTDVDEKDTVFGASQKLRDIIRHTYRSLRPEAIFVTSSCVTGIIGEDIESAVEELSSEIPVPLVAAHCEGFKSCVWAQGFDITAHAVMRGIVRPPKEKRDIINFVNFAESERAYITELLARMGMKPQFLWCNASVEELAHLSESRATTGICGALHSYVAAALEEQYGVPQIRTVSPNGMAGFDAWLREVARVVGKADEAERILAEEKARWLPEIERLRAELSGLTAVVAAGPGFTYEIVRCLSELGIRTVKAIAWHHDSAYDHAAIPETLEQLPQYVSPKLPVAVTEFQNYELLNILNCERPDVYICRHPGTIAMAAKQGFPGFAVDEEYLMFGYKGLVSFAKTIRDTLAGAHFTQEFARRCHLPYTQWWYNQKETKFFTK